MTSAIRNITNAIDNIIGTINIRGLILLAYN